MQRRPTILIPCVHIRATLDQGNALFGFPALRRFRHKLVASFPFQLGAIPFPSLVKTVCRAVFMLFRAATASATDQAAMMPNITPSGGTVNTPIALAQPVQ